MNMSDVPQDPRKAASIGMVLRDYLDDHHKLVDAYAYNTSQYVRHKTSLDEDFYKRQNDVIAQLRRLHERLVQLVRKCTETSRRSLLTDRRTISKEIPIHKPKRCCFFCLR
jgi:hypothetical protein